MTLVETVREYARNVDSEILRHERGVRIVIVATLVLTMIVSACVVAFIYKQNLTVAEFGQKIRMIDGSRKSLELEYRDTMLPIMGQMLDELSKFEGSSEKTQLIKEINDVKSELLGLRQYVTRLNDSAVSQEPLDRHAITEINEAVHRASFLLSAIKVTPFQRIADLQEQYFQLSFELSIYNTDTINEDNGYKSLVSEYASRLNDIKPKDYELYLFVTLFLLCFAVLVSLYRYHHNKIEDYVRDKNKVSKLLLTVVLREDGSQVLYKDLMYVIFSEPLSKNNVRSETELPVTALLKGVSEGLGKSKKRT